MSESSVNEREARSAVSPPIPDLSSMLDKVLSNPEIISAVASALSNNTGEGSAPSAVNEVQGSNVQGAAPPDVDAMMQKLPEVMRLISPMMAQSAPVPLPSKGGNLDGKRAALLSAIKPYMSPARCEAIDYIIKFSQLSELIKRLN